MKDTLRRWIGNRMTFRREAIILEDGRPFGEVIEPWQEEDFAALDERRHRHGYLERPRGHSKTADIATEAVTELMLGPPNQRLYCCAADKDQAGLLFDDVAGKFRRSRILNYSVKITQKDITVKATGSKLVVLPSDAPSAYGLRPDWIAIDELAEWSKRDLWDSLWSATGKRPQCRVLVISTAGWDQTSIAWEVRQIAEKEADWYFSSRAQCASWISKEWLEQQRRTLPAHVFARLHENRWVEGVGAFLTAAEVKGIFTDVLPVAEGSVIIGLDLGLTKDHTVAAVVRRDRELAVIENLLTWRPREGSKVDLTEVEADVEVLARKFNAPVITDPWQGVLMAQRLREKGVRVVEFNFTSESRRKLFGTLLDLIRNGRLKSRPHDELKRELLGLEVEETSAGWRVDHKPGRHDDHVVAVGLAVAGHPAEPGYLGWIRGEVEAMKMEEVKK